MSRGEITRKFDEIVAFAEVEKFLDTPVKRYSSGMHVRLAFAVAAHLEPEILVVDEVLAVGDAEFQRKSLGKMGDVAGHGRTVLFVSHNLDALLRISTVGYVLDSGRLKLIDSIERATRFYLDLTSSSRQDLSYYREPKFRKQGELLSVWTLSSQNHHTLMVHVGEEWQLGLKIKPKDAQRRNLALTIEDHRQTPIFTTHLTDCSGCISSAEEFSFTISLPTNIFREGQYFGTFSSFSPGHTEVFDAVMHFPLFKVTSAANGTRADGRWGSLYFPVEWTRVKG
jgi:lipopolysaccharide transport system ATP-binding protein